MEDATIINQDKQPEEQQQQPGMYQKGKYPSIIDTDDLVFEMGIQLVGNLNKEKLLDKVMQRTVSLEKTAADAVKIKIEAEKRTVVLEASNKLYIENNQKLDVELVRIRKELEDKKKESDIELTKVRKEFELVRKELDGESAKVRRELVAARSENQANTKSYEDKLIAIAIDHEEKISGLVTLQKQEIINLKNKGKKTLKKKD